MGLVVAVVHDVEAVREGTRGTLRPAGTAVLRDVLVLTPGKQVDWGCLDVGVGVSAPVEVLRKRFNERIVVLNCVLNH